MFRRLISGLFSEEGSVPRGAADARAYAVGDIHGRLDLLDELLATIRADDADRPERKTFIIFLGDLIDRGPESRGVVERLLGQPMKPMQHVFLMGNHEEALVRVLDGEKGVIWNWLKYGGEECAASYGLDPVQLSHMGEEQAIDLVHRHVPVEHRRFLTSFADTFSFGDYLFVHAGIRPGRRIEEQKRQDLRWIREPFLSDNSDHGHVVVHGHTIVDAVEEFGSRIGIDTGAYRSGILTAIAIEDDRRWYLSTARDAPAARERVASAG